MLGNCWKLCLSYPRKVLTFRRGALPYVSLSTVLIRQDIGCRSCELAELVSEQLKAMSTSEQEGECSVSAKPPESECVEITEGRAKILFPSSNEVFYNPVQEFNRDLSIAVIKYYSEHLWSPDRFRKISKPTWKSESAMEAESTGDPTTTDTLEGIHAFAHVPDDKSEDVVIKPGAESEPLDTDNSLGTGAEEAAVKREGNGGEVAMETVEADGSRKSQVEETRGNNELREPVEEESINGGEAKEKGGPGEVEGERSAATVSSTWQPHVPGLRILEGLAASGLRSIRYALEIPRAHSVLANDLSPEAYQSMSRNIECNGVGDKVTPCCKEASMLMYEHREPYSSRFDVIDLDPYGSPSQFLDSTVQAVNDGGLLCITCTDTGVLCGTHSETCHSKYGSMSLKAKFCHEMALRIVLASLESHANRYRRYIVPLLSCSVDFYVRVFVQVFTSAQEVKRSPSKLAMVYHCTGCESFHLQPIGKRIEEGNTKKYPPGTGPPVDRFCDQCGSVFRLGGPIWSAPMHNAEFVKGLLEEVKATSGCYDTAERIRGLLTVVSEELHDVPLYYVLDQLCGTLHCNTPKMLALRSAILDQGYQVSISHANANAVKTDAPHHVVWDIMRCWVQQNPVKNISPKSPAAAILSKEPRLSASFVVRKDANPPSRLLKLARFPENPANWGPKARAKRKGDGTEGLPTKRQRLQGKRKMT